jgi:hypothetical protein
MSKSGVRFKDGHLALRALLARLLPAVRNFKNWTAGEYRFP